MKTTAPSIPHQAYEWQTLLMIAANYGAFLLLTWYYHALPTVLVVLLGGYLLALFGSIQHEVIHGHPTPKTWLNEGLVFPALSLWLPFKSYKLSHLQHHNNKHLTYPERDPESYYQLPQRWSDYSRGIQFYYYVLNTLLGRMLLGPLHVVTLFFYDEFKALWQGNQAKWRMWLVHGLSCVLVLYWVVVVCAIPVLEYIVFIVYPGLSLTLLRSFLEHEAVATIEYRTVVVDAGWLLSLMFLNNNLHALHHIQPKLAWYNMPKVWRQQREAILASNNHYYYSSYWDIAWRYGVRAKENPCFPL